jgi:hypothetical protein
VSADQYPPFGDAYWLHASISVAWRAVPATSAVHAALPSTTCVAGRSEVAVESDEPPVPGAANATDEAAANTRAARKLRFNMRKLLIKSPQAGAHLNDANLKLPRRFGDYARNCG